MNRTALRPTRSAQAGVSLVELMVSITIGLAVVAVVLQIFLGGKQTFRAQDDTARLQENGRFVVDLLGRELRMAGFEPNAGRAAFSATSNATTHITGRNGTGANGSDEVTVRYFGFNEVDGSVEGGVVNCLGVSQGGATLVTDILYVAADAANNSEPTLFCDTTDDSTVNGTALVPGVENLQILYGLDSDGDGLADRFVPAPAALADWAKVVAAQVSVVLRSAQTTATAAQARTFNHFGNDYAPSDTAPAGDAGAVFSAPADARLRRAFTATVGMRNRLF
ncbi:MAG: PilW family protein [Betaproteobacteria bacterium]|nr:PilW family protein [Betaproteobacteria bacterium]